MATSITPYPTTTHSPARSIHIQIPVYNTIQLPSHTHSSYPPSIPFFIHPSTPPFFWYHPLYTNPLRHPPLFPTQYPLLTPLQNFHFNTNPFNNGINDQTPTTLTKYQTPPPLYIITTLPHHYSHPHSLFVKPATPPTLSIRPQPTTHNHLSVTRSKHPWHSPPTHPST